MNKYNKSHLKYCVVCNYVWEWDAVLRIQVRYESFPTYGLERAYCSNCNKEQVHVPAILQLSI